MSIYEDAQERAYIPSPPPEEPDVIKSPKHYDVLPGVEAKDIIEATLTKLYGPEAYKAYCHGNMIKYVLRHKGSTEQDIGKAGRYSEMYTGDDK